MTKAIILAAGQGTRLLPYTKDLPKCMVEICGKPLIEFQIEVLKSCGLENISLVGGYKLEKLKKFKLPIYENKNFASTNMLYSLFCARDLFKDDEDLIISYGDIVYSKEILKDLVSANNAVNVIIDRNWQEYWESRFENVLEDAETLILNDTNEIIEIGREPKDLSQIQGQYIGLIKLNKNGKEIFLENCPTLLDENINGKSFNNAYMTDFLQELINRGKCVKAFTTRFNWIEIDRVEDLKSAVTCSRLKNIIHN